MCLRSKNSEFDHLDTMLPIPMCFRGGNKTCCVPLLYMVRAFIEKRSFWNHYILHVVIKQNVIFEAFQIRCYLWTKLAKIYKISKIWRPLFVFRPKNAIFRSKMTNSCNYMKRSNMDLFFCFGLNMLRSIMIKIVYHYMIQPLNEFICSCFGTRYRFLMLKIGSAETIFLFYGN